MADMETGNEAGQESASTTERIPSETATAQAAGNEQSSNSQTQAAATTNSTNSTNNNQQTNSQNQGDPQIKELRREAANYRTQLKDVQGQLDAATATRSQIEAERDALRTELRDIRVTGTIREIVSLAQPVAIEPVLAIIGKDFKVDGRTGEVDADAISAAVTEAHTKYPFLFKGANLGADAGAGSGGYVAGSDMNRALRQAAGFNP